MGARGIEPRPDLVDRAALAERLGVNATTVARWDRRSVLPSPDVVLGGTDLWLWETIREWARHKSRFAGSHRKAPVLPDLVHTGDLAQRLDIEPRTVEIWLRKGSLPQPDYRWEATDGWLWETIAKWKESALNGRLIGHGRDVVARSPARPRGPRLAVAARAETESPEPASAPNPPVMTPAAAQEKGPAVPVSPVRQPSHDPIRDFERLQRYFSAMAGELREPAADAALRR